MSIDQKHSPFVVTELKPTGIGVGLGAVYQLSPASAAPTVIAGRDRRGMPIEATIPTVHWRPFVTADGCINKVPLRTRSVFSREPEDMKYERQIVQDAIAAGWIPLIDSDDATICPLAPDHGFRCGVPGGAFAAAVAGETPCDGRHGYALLESDPMFRGCVHMQRIVHERRAAAQEAYEAEQKKYATMKADDVARLVSEIGAAITDGMQQQRQHPSDVKAARSRLQRGEGE